MMNGENYLSPFFHKDWYLLVFFKRQIHTFNYCFLFLGGTFYLPYRHHYSLEQLYTAYPMIEKFFERKVYYDPQGMFSSSWSKNYMGQIREKLKPKLRQVVSRVGKVLNLASSHTPRSTLLIERNPKMDKNFVIPIVSQHRNDSYR